MQYTSNLNLRKPDYTDVIDIADLNANADALDEAVAGLQTSMDDRYTKDEVDKLLSNSGSISGTDVTATAATDIAKGSFVYLLTDESGNYTVYSGMDGIPGSGYKMGIASEDIVSGATGAVKLIADPKMEFGEDDEVTALGVPRRSTITLKASAWNADTKSQIIAVPHVSADEATQIINISPVEEYEYLAAEIIAEVHSTNRIKFTAGTIPEVDIVVHVIIEDVVAQNDDGTEVLFGSEAVTLVADVPVNWTADGNYFYQDVEVAGMSGSYDFFTSCVMGDDLDINALIKEAFGLVQSIDTYDGYVRIWCSDAPEVEFTIRFDTIGWYKANTYPAAEGVGF